ncbi:hypothetical protein ABIA33_003707 [Streptacidiphilus sp. MAP12-16]|uniref:hypothetical protein n=1 Tax=Streptacidiphilus sp. MAP12-16 TaxID=3156300 RepID=UPI00351746A5
MGDDSGGGGDGGRDRGGDGGRGTLVRPWGRAAYGVALAVLAAVGVSACGTGHTGYVAVGVGGPAASVRAVLPTGNVVFVPLGPTPSGSGQPSGNPTSSTAPAVTTGGAGGAGSGAVPATGRTAAGGTGRASSGGGSPSPGAPSRGQPAPGPSSPVPPAASPTPTPPTPAPPPTLSPASLSASAPSDSAGSQRWCQNVTLTLTNSGGRAADAATVTFSTHVIGALGTDWWTYQTQQPLHAPVPGHASATETWSVCLDSWRVPAGMHLETRSASIALP